MRPPGTQPFSDQHQASASTAVPETTTAPSIVMVLSCHEAKITSTQEDEASLWAYWRLPKNVFRGGGVRQETKWMEIFANTDGNCWWTVFAGWIWYLVEKKSLIITRATIMNRQRWNIRKASWNQKCNIRVQMKCKSLQSQNLGSGRSGFLSIPSEHLSLQNLFLSPGFTPLSLAITCF